MLCFKYSIGHGFELKPSQIPNSGDGIYTAQTFVKHTLLSCYDGKRFTKDEADKKGDAHYQLELGDCDDDMVIDASYIKRKSGACIGGFINDPRNYRLTNAQPR